MKSFSARARAAFRFAAAIALSVVALGGGAPAQTAPSASSPASQVAGERHAFAPEEIDQMLAPIALYPDALLAQVLTASTYPLEVVQADQWREAPSNAGLQGDALAAALEPLTWDPSVKSLVPFPAVLDQMSNDIAWTQRVGDAVLAQRDEVMVSVQRLRRKAHEAGSLASNDRQIVVLEQETIVIRPASPEIVYVPAYDTRTVYGTWSYPAYPPVYYPPPPYYYPAGSAFVSGLAFATGVAIVGSLWGWGDCDWRGHDIHVDANRYNSINVTNINAGRATVLPAGNPTWRHDPVHRVGVAYRDPATRDLYRGPLERPRTADRARPGYPEARPADRGAAPGPARAPAQARIAPGAGRPGVAGPAAGRPAAFQGVGSGRETRAQSERGRSSRQAMAASGNAHPAPKGGGNGGRPAKASGGPGEPALGSGRR